MERLIYIKNSKKERIYVISISMPITFRDIVKKCERKSFIFDIALKLTKKHFLCVHQSLFIIQRWPHKMCENAKFCEWESHTKYFFYEHCFRNKKKYNQKMSFLWSQNWCEKWQNTFFSSYFLIKLISISEKIKWEQLGNWNTKLFF